MFKYNTLLWLKCIKFSITCQELSLRYLGMEVLETILDYILFWFLFLTSLELVDFKMEERGKHSFCVWFCWSVSGSGRLLSRSRSSMESVYLLLSGQVEGIYCSISIFKVIDFILGSSLSDSVVSWVVTFCWVVYCIWIQYMNKISVN